MLAYSQDVIITKNAEKIEAKIIEVSSAEIKYKKLSNLEGPTFVLLSSEVASVIYENGDVKVYENEILPKNIEQAMNVADKYIIRKGNKYYCGEKMLRGVYYKKYLYHNNCLQAYDLYEEGENLSKWGWGIFGVSFVYALSAVNFLGCDGDVGLMLCTCLSISCAAASIPILIVGYNKMHRSAEIYNTTCGKQQPQAYWSINASQNGIGLAFNF